MNSNFSFGSILYRTVGALIFLTMLSASLVSSTYAKYIVTDSASDSARVAQGSGFELLEYGVKLVNGVYELDKTATVKGITYEKVIPGVDIVKEPFIQIDKVKLEVSYELYLRVVESKYFPDTVTYKLTDDWDYDEVEDVYKYKYVFDAGSTYVDKIQILENNKLYVNEHYVGDGKEFSLGFDAWIRQVD